MKFEFFLYVLLWPFLAVNGLKKKKLLDDRIRPCRVGHGNTENREGE